MSASILFFTISLIFFKEVYLKKRDTKTYVIKANLDLHLKSFYLLFFWVIQFTCFRSIFHLQYCFQRIVPELI